MASNYTLANMKEMINFRKTVNDHEDGIVSFLRLWKASDEIHTDFIPFPHRDRQWLKSTSRSLVLCLNATTNITFSNKFEQFIASYRSTKISGVDLGTFSYYRDESREVCHELPEGSSVLGFGFLALRNDSQGIPFLDHLQRNI